MQPTIQLSFDLSFLQQWTSVVNHLSLVIATVTFKDGGITELQMNVSPSYTEAVMEMRTTS